MTPNLILSAYLLQSTSAVTRLVDLGIEPYMVAATLQGVLAQRLVRRVCSHCGEWAEADDALRSIMPVHQVGQRVRRGDGCALCRQTGYLGRIGIFELLVLNDVIRSQIARSPEASRIRELAREEEMRSLLDDARAKVFDGLTTPEEVLRAIER